jgi:hypothetical protein
MTKCNWNDCIRLFERACTYECAWMRAYADFTLFMSNLNPTNIVCLVIDNIKLLGTNIIQKRHYMVQAITDNDIVPYLCDG